MDKPTHIEIPRLERRSAVHELRAVGDEMRIGGHAAVFNELSVELWGFREQIAPGAFVDAIKRSDAKALFNHDPRLILGRMKAQTLRVWEDERGLAFECDLPDTQMARDLLVSIKRGDITQMSFAFSVAEGGDDWAYVGPNLIRTVNRVEEVFDVSPVTYPAYEGTVVSNEARSHAAALQSAHNPAAGANGVRIAEEQALHDMRKRRIELAGKEFSF